MCGVSSSGNTFMNCNIFLETFVLFNQSLPFLRISTPDCQKFCKYKFTLIFNNRLFWMLVKFNIRCAGDLSGLWWSTGSLLQWFLKSAGKLVLIFDKNISLFWTKSTYYIVLCSLFQRVCCTTQRPGCLRWRLMKQSLSPEESDQSCDAANHSSSLVILQTSAGAQLWTTITLSL